MTWKIIQGFQKAQIFKNLIKIEGLHTEKSLLNNSVSKGSQIYEANLALKPIYGRSGRRALIAHNRLTH